MQRFFSHRNRYKIGSFLNTCLFHYKKLIFITSLVLLIGLLTGIFTAVRFAGAVKLEKITDYAFIDFLKNAGSGFNLFFPHLLNFTVLTVVIVVFNFNPFMQVFSYIALIYSGYCVGLNLTVLVILYGVIGFINVFFILLPFELLINAILVFCAAVSIKRCLIIKRYGCIYERRHSFLNARRLCFCLYLTGFVILLLKCLFVPVIRFTIIVAP